MLLESSIKDQIRTNERLLFKLKILERKIQETGKGVDQLFEEDPKLLKDSPNSQTILTDIHLVSISLILTSWTNAFLTHRTTLSSVSSSLPAIE